MTIVLDRAQATGIAPVSVIVATSPEWRDRHAACFAGDAVDARFVTGGAALADLLAHEWQVDLVVLDLALATSSLAERLGQGGPALLAFGDPTNAGLALAANLADFIDEAIDDAGLTEAIMAAVARVPRTGVSDLSDRSSARLNALGAEAERVAAAISRLEAPPAATGDIDIGVVRGLIHARRVRERYFPAAYLGEPVWDMLLDLALAREEGRRVSVSSLCLAAGVPTSTALRAIRSLCDAGLFDRTSDPLDARRAFIALAEPGMRGMAAYLAKLAEA